MKAITEFLTVPLIAVCVAMAFESPRARIDCVLGVKAACEKVGAEYGSAKP